MRPRAGWAIPTYGDQGTDRRRFPWQAEAAWHATGTAGGQTVFQLDAPAAGVALFGAAALPWQIDLPDGSVVTLTDELVPEAHRLGIPRPSSLPWFVDRGLRLRIARGGTTVAEGWLQRPSFLAGQLRLAAGLAVDASGELAVYAHAGMLPVPSVGAALEASPQVSVLAERLASPFGRGVSLLAPAGPGAPVGTVRATATAVRVASADHPARSWFAHCQPLEDRLELVPEATAIADRPTDRIAWGRHRATVASAPLPWSLAAIEAGGHPEWIAYGDRWLHHPGASPLWDRGWPPVLVPAAAHRVNLSADAAANARLAVLRASWAEPPSGWATGSHDLGQPLGGWCEWRDAGWGTAPAYQWTDLAGTTRSVTGSALWVAARRVDATNLGAITDAANAVEVTRLIVDWQALVRLAVTPQLGAPSTEYRAAGSPTDGLVLSEADAAALLAGDPVTLAGSYLQGDYPTRTTVGIGGTLTLRAVG